MDDPDAPMGLWVHWLVWNIPPNTPALAKGQRIAWPQGTTSWGRPGYGGPAPPSGTHRYFFKLYALDTALDLKPSAKKADVEKAMKGHILCECQLMGTYCRAR
jgi:Raf kinase inhibitor-like YbhB/YbcL family protein